MVNDDYSSLKRSPQNFKVGTVWTEANRGGLGGILNVGSIPSACTNFIPPFSDAITSIQIDPGFLCNFFMCVVWF